MEVSIKTTAKNVNTEDTVLGHFKKFEQKPGQGISSLFRLTLKGFGIMQTIRTFNVGRTIRKNGVKTFHHNSD